MVYLRKLLIVLSFLLVAQLVEASDYKLKKINAEGTRVIISAPARSLSVGDYMSAQDEFANKCIGKVIKVESRTAVLDVENCTNAKSLKIGENFEPSSAPPVRIREADESQAAAENGKKSGSGPTLDESWYTLWGLGISRVTYGDTIDDAFEDADNYPGVDRTTTNLDLFGFYWPLANKVSMQGFIINIVSDTLHTNYATFTVAQTLYAYSFHHFFGANIGDSWFLRGDVGLVQYVIDIDTRVFEATEDSEFGLGALAGGGYAWGIGTDTRMLLGGYISRRGANGDASGKIESTSANITLGFLF